jgi:fibro-slime domain-containing protein
MPASWSVRCEKLVLVLALALASVGGTSCGRTGLRLIDPCEEDGAERDCDDACGTGTQVCADGTWSTCSVPSTLRACQNDCGTGVQTCEAGSWGSCEVPTATRGCSGICGEGTQTCVTGSWGSCDVPPSDQPCDNVCGSGLQHCEDGRLGLCEVPVVTRDCESGCGSGHEACVAGRFWPCDAPKPNPPLLTAVIRDFSPMLSPDFERPPNQRGDDPGIVKPLLGPDDKPEWSGDPSIHTVESKATFDTWYHDVPGLNVHLETELALVASLSNPGFFVYDDQQFFPIDEQGFGNEGNLHNYHFTLEAKLTFRYSGGERFSFTGDDDMWVFINRHLAINLGGLHQSESQSVSLDERAGELELEHGESYAINIFFAERHTIQSTFKLETSVADQGACPR